MKNEEARHVPSSLSLACYFEDITLLLEAETVRGGAEKGGSIRR